MNEMYLFDKTGSDSEIEQIEELLSIYKIRPDPPTFSSIAAVQRSSLLWYPILLGRSLAFAALVLSMGIGAAIYLIRPAALSVELRNNAVVEPPTSSNIETPAPVKLAISVKKRPRQATEAAPVSNAIVKKSQKTRMPKSELAKLTPEERHAYNEVLAALWLTGSTLKVVQNTINRVDDDRDDTDKK